MKIVLVLSLLATLNTASAQTQTLMARVICGNGVATSATEAIRRANDDLNKKLKLGVKKIQSISEPKFLNDDQSADQTTICVSVVAEEFSDLVL